MNVKRSFNDLLWFSGTLTVLSTVVSMAPTSVPVGTNVLLLVVSSLSE